MDCLKNPKILDSIGIDAAAKKLTAKMTRSGDEDESFNTKCKI